MYLCGVNERRDIIVSDTLTGIGKGEVAGYLCHAYCHKGFCEFKYNNNVYRLKVGECLIIRRGDLVERVNESDDFRWDASEVSLLQVKVFRKQGLLYGRLSSLGFDSKLRAMAENLKV